MTELFDDNNENEVSVVFTFSIGQVFPSTTQITLETVLLEIACEPDLSRRQLNY